MAGKLGKAIPMQKRWVITILISAFLLASCSQKQEVQVEKKDFIAICNKLSEDTVKKCSQNTNWQVLKDGITYLGTYDCMPAPQASDTYSEEVENFEEQLPAKDVILVANEDFWDELSCSDDPSKLLEEAIAQKKVSVETRDYIK